MIYNGIHPKYITHNRSGVIFSLPLENKKLNGIYRLDDNMQIDKIMDGKYVQVNCNNQFIVFQKNTQYSPIYAYDMSKSKKIKVSDKLSGTYFFIYIYDNWIYTQSESEGIVRFHLDDRKMKARLSDKGVIIGIHNDKVFYYYVNKHEVYKMNLDGTNKTKICKAKNMELPISIDDEFIYYNAKSNICRINLSSGCIDEISDRGYFLVYDNMLYRLRDNAVSQITITEGSLKTLIDKGATNQKINDFIVKDNYIYYIVNHDTLCRTDVNNCNEQTLFTLQ